MDAYCIVVLILRSKCIAESLWETLKEMILLIIYSGHVTYGNLTLC